MMSFRRTLTWTALPAALALFGIVGCVADAGSSKAPEATEQAEQPAAEAPSDAPRMAHAPPGPEFLLVAALKDLDLTPAQQATIQGSLDKLTAERREHGRELFGVLAEGVRAGKIDESRIAAKLGNVDQKMAEHRTALASALDTLHSTLTSEQRKTLVSTLEAKIDEHRGRGEKGERGPEAHEGFGKHAMGPLGFFLRGIELTDAQRDAIKRAREADKPIVADHEAMKKHFEAFHAELRSRLESFASDSFDAKAFVTPPAGAERMGPKAHVERMIKELNVVIPILDASQRETLAANLEKGPPTPAAH